LAARGSAEPVPASPLVVLALRLEVLACRWVGPEWLLAVPGCRWVAEVCH